MNRPQTLLPSPQCRIGLVFLAALLGAGCGGVGKGDISGTVLYQGKPVSKGTINFLNDQNEVLGSAVINDGKYAVFKIPAGPVKITVSTPLLPKGKGRPLRKRGPDLRKKPAPGGAEPPKDQAPPPERSAPPIIIPAQYADPNQSGLTYIVQPGEQVHDIELP